MIAIGSDHAGFEYKENLKKLLDEIGKPYQDFGIFLQMLSIILMLHMLFLRRWPPESISLEF